MPLSFFRKRHRGSMELAREPNDPPDISAAIGLTEEGALVDRAVNAFLRYPNTDQEGILVAMIFEGIDSETAWRLYQFVPMAFCHVLYRRAGPQFSSRFEWLNPRTGARTMRALQEDPIYLAAIRAAEERSQAGATVRPLAVVAGFSAEANVIAQAKADGSSVQHLVLGDPLLIEYPCQGPGEMDLEEKLTFVRRAVAERLSQGGGLWRVEGELVQGPGSLAVRTVEIPNCGFGHVVLGITLNRDRADAPVIWDCATGFAGKTIEQALQQAVDTWAVCTTPVVFELLVQNGSLADHFHDGEQHAFPGWHVIHGPFLPIHMPAARVELLRKWALEHPLLPALESALCPHLDRPQLNGVKLFFGSVEGEDMAEVRVNGQLAAEPTAVLRSMSWPRASGGADFLRSFVLFVHPEP